MQKKKIIIFGGVFTLAVGIIVGGYFLIKQNIAKSNHGGREPEVTNRAGENAKTIFRPKIKWEIVKDNEDIIRPISLLENKQCRKKRRVEDVREYQHGVDFIQKSDGSYILIWASSGDALKPWGARDDGEWIHDVYYSNINQDNPIIKPVKIIKAPLAQEPVSTAINSEGHLMITMEDAWRAKNVLAQTYGVYDEEMESIKPYQQVVFDGGHSGHVAAVGNKFVVFYSNEWVDGGGVDNLGSGDDVLMNVYDTNGDIIAKKNVSVGKKYRDWWPLVAGSKDKVFLLWQRFVPGKKFVNLMLSIYDDNKNEFVQKQLTVEQGVKYYTYDIQYLKDIDRFLISGAYAKGGGFFILLSGNGKIIVKKETNVAIGREVQPAIKMLNKNEVKVVYPAGDNLLLVMSITKSEIVIDGEIKTNCSWEMSGTDGVFLNDNKVYFVGTSPSGLKEVKVEIYKQFNK